MKKVAVLGEGAFGTAMACLLADCGVDVLLWCHDVQVVHQIHEAHVNQRYMQGVCLAQRINPTQHIGQAVDGTEIIFVTTPVKFLRSVLESAQPYYAKDQIWVFLGKGIEQDTLMLPTQIANDVFGDGCHKAVMMGPSFARELIEKQPTQIIVACDVPTIAEELQKFVFTPYFNTIVSDDAIGVQLCAAYKNVIALGVGMLHGAGYGENVRALLITKGLHEMALLVDASGGAVDTVASLAGIGDLVLTACSSKSRNITVGSRIGKGESLDAILKDMDAIPEGVTTAQALSLLSQEAELSLPITCAVKELIGGECSMESLIQLLMGHYSE